VPLSTVSFSTLAPHYRNEGTALFSLMRNIGSSIGISVAMTRLAQNLQVNHAAYSEYINPFNLSLRQGVESGVFDLGSSQGLAAINNLVTRQAAALSYLQDFRLMMWITLCVVPLILLLKGPNSAKARDAGMQTVVELE
jgi:DHA2 family multidrug resistance protein